ncbi:class I SAM-dependent methyltransferase [Edaphobacter aggregans]|uniref:class I SAM-dependent methyltransferase n=1 Tax=Edaphobacter aggregans TaxID=570835 RepID=UPI0005554B93|nr:class I SAM-dependent methyltransferase [Edaphobacter aggregans]
MATPVPAIDESKLNAFMGQAVQDMGAAMHAALVVVGDKLGLYKAMAGAGPLTPAQLAQKTSTDERYVREWLNANAAGGYIAYNPATRTYTLPPEQALALAVEDSPAFLPGAFQMISAVMRDAPKITDAFRTGRGVGWHEHDAELFQGTERFFRPNYAANLISQWIPSLTGVKERLESGARVADVGCGHGSSTILMAKAFPKSTFFGFDYHPASIERARQTAKEAGVADHITFEVAAAKDYPGKDYDLITFFDCLHDMGDPVGASAHVRSTLAPNGSWMIVEPFANDKVEDNLNPVGRVYYSASTMICTPASRSQEVGLALGAQAGEARMRDVVLSGGFTNFRRAAETPFNLVYEAKP